MRCKPHSLPKIESEKSKGLASQYDAVIGDIHFISVEEEQDESTN